jgi:hypothetical protein
MKGSLLVGTVAMTLTACPASGPERMTPVDAEVISEVGSSQPVDERLAFASAGDFCGCESMVTDRIVTLSIGAPDGRGAGNFTFRLCRMQGARYSTCLPSEGQSGDDASRGAGYNALAQVKVASAESVTVLFNTTYDDGSGVRRSGQGELTTRLAGAAEVRTSSGIVAMLRYHYGH